MPRPSSHLKWQVSAVPGRKYSRLSLHLQVPVDGDPPCDPPSAPQTGQGLPHVDVRRHPGASQHEVALDLTPSARPAGWATGCLDVDRVQ